MYKRSNKVLLLLAVIIAVGNWNTTVAAAPGVAKASIQKESRQYYIDRNGGGDFRTIQEGVDNASDGDTLMLYPGTYTEEVQVMNKEISIIGVSKELCILKCDTASYRKAPLTIAAGKVANLTIYGTDNKTAQEELTEEEIASINAQIVGDSWDRQKNYTGYAVHIDQNFLYGRSITFENCNIISENNHCVGIGSRGKSAITFENCELVSLGRGSCIYLHDPTSADVSGEAALAMRSCNMTSYLCPYVMTLQSLLPEYNSMKFTFQDTHISAVAYAEDESYVPINVNTDFDVETLAQFERMGGLHIAGMSSSAAELVHEMQPADARNYMKEVESALDTGNALKLMASKLPEGITYLGEQPAHPAGCLKHQVIAIYNRNNLPGSGWCGLDNAYLTTDSYGNTLPEMNAIETSLNTPNTVGIVSTGFPAFGY